MKIHFLFILVTISLFSQKSIKDPFVNWKSYKNSIDLKIRNKILKVKQNEKMMCPNFHSVTTYSEFSKVVMIKGESCGECGCLGYDLYFKDNQLLVAISYFDLDPTLKCNHVKSYSEIYYIKDGKIVNFKELHSDKKEEDLLNEIRKAEKSLHEIQKTKCFE